jgi:hypothetical protein
VHWDHGPKSRVQPCSDIWRHVYITNICGSWRSRADIRVTQKWYFFQRQPRPTAHGFCKPKIRGIYNGPLHRNMTERPMSPVFSFGFASDRMAGYRHCNHPLALKLTTISLCLINPAFHVFHSLPCAICISNRLRISGTTLCISAKAIYPNSSAHAYSSLM